MEYWRNRCARNKIRVPPVTKMVLHERSGMSAALNVDAPNPNMMQISLNCGVLLID